ncbi:TRAP transporter small permease subunit [Hahella ganghwensis]|uniref:TRAP transporter small permease subunit n=1 Tax=Hahella ganghwensis TaxID=286420 RepID=UPI000377B292|nr:TRAP transporter small permease [Hahella ganghwensis]
MERLYCMAVKLSRISAWVGGGLLLLSAAITTVDVILRKLFNISMGGSDEIAGYILAITTSWGLSFALLSRANIRIDALYARLPGKLTIWLDMLGLILVGAFMSFVTWFAIGVWFESVSVGATANTPLQTPLMIPQGLWAAGFIIFMCVLLILLTRVLVLLWRGDHKEVSAIAGIRTVEEEVHDEVASVIDHIKEERRHAC